MSCPACSGDSGLRLVEERLDPIGGKNYRVLECPACGVVSSEPREAVGADWYAAAAPLRGRETRSRPEADWRFAQFFSDRLPPGRLLDVGCGDGGFMRLAQRAGFKTTGFDYDARVADMARAAGLDAHAQEFSEFVASRKTGEFDALTLFDVLEHVPEPALFLGELKKLLRRGGHAAFTMPNGLRPLPFGREEHDFPPHHFTRWTPDALRRFLERQGFEVVRQDAGTLRLRYLSDHAFFHWLMPPVLTAAKRALFKNAPAEATVSQLYDGKGGALADKGTRQRLVEAARVGFSAAFFPAAVVWRAYYRFRRTLTGDTLYTLARLK